MNPVDDQAMRTVLDHGAGSVMRQLRVENERLRNELAMANANIGNRYLRSVLNLIDKHREMHPTVRYLDVLDRSLVLADDAVEYDEMLNGLAAMPIEQKLRIIPALCKLGYFVLEDGSVHSQTCPFSVNFNMTEERIRRVYHGFFARGGILHLPTNISE